MAKSWRKDARLDTEESQQAAYQGFINNNMTGEAPERIIRQGDGKMTSQSEYSNLHVLDIALLEYPSPLLG